MEPAATVPAAELAPGPIGRPLSAKDFWELMERWRVSNAVALELIGFAGEIGKSGKRPRFRFSPPHKRVTTYLAEIDSALRASGQGTEWLQKKTRAAPFAGKTPVALMVAAGMDGMEKTLELVHRSVWRSALKKTEG